MTDPWDWYIYLHEWLICMLNVEKNYQSHGSFFGTQKWWVLIEFDVIKSGSVCLGVHQLLFLMGACAWLNSSLSQLTLKLKETIQQQQSSNNNNNSNNRVQREQPKKNMND